MLATSRTHTVVGVFDDYATAQRVITRLEEAGVRRDDIEITSNQTTRKDRDRSSGARDPEDSGGVSGFFRRLFGDDEIASSDYREAVRRGNVVVTVDTDEHRQERVANIMNESGAVDIDRKAETWRQEGYTPPHTSAEDVRASEFLEEGKGLGTRAGTSPAYDPSAESSQRSVRSEGGNIRSEGGNIGKRPQERTQESRSIPVVQEELRVGKRAVQRGGVRVYTRVHNQPVEEQVRLREERVRVDRRPTDRPATDADIRDHDDVVEVTEMAEEAVIDKKTRVVEEIVVAKDVSERTETIRDTVRRSDVNVERLGREAGYDDYDADFRNDFETRYGSDRSARYEEYSPAYQYGYRQASDERYRGRSWNEVEGELRRDYESGHPGSLWERMQESVRYGWNKVSDRRGNERFTDYDDDFRSDFRTRYGSVQSARYEDYQPAYQYGYQKASDDRYRGRSWNDVEGDLRRDYESRYPSSTWERMKDSVRYGWDKVTGRR